MDDRSAEPSTRRGGGDQALIQMNILIRHPLHAELFLKDISARLSAFRADVKGGHGASCVVHVVGGEHSDTP